MLQPEVSYHQHLPNG